MPKWKQTQHRNKVDFVFVLLWNEFTVTDDEHIFIEHLIILLSSFENKCYFFIYWKMSDIGYESSFQTRNKLNNKK